MKQLLAIGEALIDFAPEETGKELKDVSAFKPKVGGAPANVCGAYVKLGGEAAMITQLGDDPFGDKIVEEFQNCGIQCDYVRRTNKANTSLAFVALKEDGNREFSFYRKPGADMMLKEEEVDYDLIRQSKVFHFGTLSMTDEPVKTATKRALSVAKEAGCMITFDPNLRPPLWKTLDEAKEQMEYGFENCDVLKISDNEIQFVSGEEDYDKGIKYLQEKYQIPLIFLTMGKEGSRAYYKNLRVEQPGFTVKAIETTGAGDTFCGCSINGVLKYGLDNLDEEKLKEILTYANAGAALITMKKGAIRSMPEPQNIKELIGE